MMAVWSGRARRSVCVSVCLVVAALVLVPALVRALQHWDPHQPIRTSIKLNWNGDAPRTKHIDSPHQVTPDLLAARPIAQAPKNHVRLADTEAPVAPNSLLSGPPNELRGPPASTLS
jgi:hypothetical protein